tara:strand:- start:1267 stop:1491 length:225 start_codon:yes stop_codon:yes gene_type:complete
MKYVIILAEDVANVDFNQVLETSENTLRYSLDNQEALVKFRGSTPTFLIGKVQHDYEGIMDILSGPNWSSEEII